VILLGAIAWIAALDPPALVGIFGTIGVYGLLVASLPAVLFGVVMKRPPSALGVGVASVVALAIHMALYYGGVTINTGLTASIGLLVALPLPFLFPARKAEAVAPAQDESQRLVAV
jgi:SSS family solute:Na+ symporter/sodium/pantothenate symporter